MQATKTKGSPIEDPRPFDEAERKRFHNLLTLANESPYEGERTAALAAAERMAKARGMDLEGLQVAVPHRRAQNLCASGSLPVRPRRWIALPG